MKDPSKTCNPETSPVSPKSTCSVEYQSGLTHSGNPDGPITVPCGADPVHASHSAPQARVRDSTTTGTSGPSFSGSSASAALTSSLASRLRTKLEPLGSTRFNLTWRKKNSPAGVSFSQLVASARRTSVSDSTGWRTPTGNDHKGGSATRPDVDHILKDQAPLAGWPTPRVGGNPQGYGNADRPNGPRGRLEDTVPLAGWPTPQASDMTGGGQVKRALNPERSNDLNDHVMLAGWPTPRDADGKKNIRTKEGADREIERKGGPQDTVQAAQLAGWPTPRAQPSTESVESAAARGTKNGQNPEGIAQLAAWPTPSATKNSKDPKRMKEGGVQSSLADAAWLAHGPARRTVGGRILHGSSAGMASGGQLNPSLPEWLMGLPPEWREAGERAGDALKRRKKDSSTRSRKKPNTGSDCSKDTATPSSRPRRKSSSKQ